MNRLESLATCDHFNSSRSIGKKWGASWQVAPIGQPDYRLELKASNWTCPATRQARNFGSRLWNW